MTARRASGRSLGKELSVNMTFGVFLVPILLCKLMVTRVSLFCFWSVSLEENITNLWGLSVDSLWNRKVYERRVVKIMEGEGHWSNDIAIRNIAKECNRGLGGEKSQLENCLNKLWGFFLVSFCCSTRK